ncbi:hypothetical protein [Ferrimonas marina]|uniref:Uncharacterized protein n=1 Tax=Ferrimonas marina TaxID=299255 RepID=A0A1M5U9K3_9GAMM|nr:hypothetical protein [Ferrimonas marina]SHH59629.1 hypothetical protein SAMN02745129_2465 [Ferrimonas marina]
MWKWYKQVLWWHSRHPEGVLLAVLLSALCWFAAELPVVPLFVGLLLVPIIGVGVVGNYTSGERGTHALQMVFCCYSPKSNDGHYVHQVFVGLVALWGVAGWGGAWLLASSGIETGAIVARFPVFTGVLSLMVMMVMVFLAAVSITNVHMGMFNSERVNVVLGGRDWWYWFTAMIVALVGCRLSGKPWTLGFNLALIWLLPGWFAHTLMRIAAANFVEMSKQRAKAGDE